MSSRASLRLKSVLVLFLTITLWLPGSAVTARDIDIGLWEGRATARIQGAVGIAMVQSPLAPELGAGFQSPIPEGAAPEVADLLAVGARPVKLLASLSSLSLGQVLQSATGAGLHRGRETDLIGESLWNLTMEDDATSVFTESGLQTQEYALMSPGSSADGVGLWAPGQKGDMPVAFTTSALRLTSSATPLGIKGLTYRGVFIVFQGQGSNGITVVNRLPIEEYLRGVVPGEMPASWPLEALKAQAVAARTYAVGNPGRFSSRGFDLTDTVMSQVYRGIAWEQPSTDRAIRETAGLVARHNGRLISALYFSHSGGHTASAEEVWGGSVPYLVGTSATFEGRYSWRRFLTAAEVNDAILGSTALFSSLRGPDLQGPTAFSVTGRTPSGRADNVYLETARERVEIPAVQFRSKVGSFKIRSTRFTVDPVPSLVTFTSPGIEATLLLPPGDSLMASGFPATLAFWYNGQVRFISSASSSTSLGSQLGPFMMSYPLGFVVSGEGYGHGVGMSQWGARGMAGAGHGFEDILKNFYRGITVEPH